jgi:hypothetical protein
MAKSNAMVRKLDEAKKQKSAALTAKRAAQKALNARPSRAMTIGGSAFVAMGGGLLDALARRNGLQPMGKDVSLYLGAASALGAVFTDSAWLEVIATGTLAGHARELGLKQGSMTETTEAAA